MLPRRVMLRYVCNVNASVAMYLSASRREDACDVCVARRVFETRPRVQIVFLIRDLCLRRYKPEARENHKDSAYLVVMVGGVLVLPTKRACIEYSPVVGHVAIIASRWQCQIASLARIAMY
ncbi:hypothetical protein E5Q_06218 [Mixia osmundae IAM 14324]|uniref:Uncharacterized protein n=1 Tax=Mixia osmundae (strain CBS 9802 / IAM 14324 / JCM 22182 / KY 12970) TaxID=764103 RepID=G7E8P9_MIXOS|nr:hypothetical protein E5Q_06218 [Mixia osmundae IAM 14324]